MEHVSDAVGDREEMILQRSSQEIFSMQYPQLRRFAAMVADLDVDPDDLVQEALASTLRRHSLAELDSPSSIR